MALLRPTRAWLVAALTLALLAPLARAACRSDSLANSNFKIKYDNTSSSDSVCFTVSSDGSCDTADTCCFNGAISLKSIWITGADPACLKRASLRGMQVTVDGSPYARPGRALGRGNMNLKVRGAVTGGTKVCLDLSASSCSTPSDLCSSGSCSVRLNTNAAMKDLYGTGRMKRISCCVSSTLGVSGGGTGGTGGGTGGGYTTPGVFNIKLINTGTNKALDSQFQAAADRWASILKVDVTDAPAGVDYSGGEIKGFSYTDAVDDLVIFYALTYIDGVNNILGQAGPIVSRKDGSALAISGIMEFDSSDYAADPNPDYWSNVILHEMGHVLGIGTIWDVKKCMVGCVEGSGSANYYLCKNARAKYTELGCAGNLPIETQMGQGSGCSHWAEATLKAELMTPQAEAPGTAMPLSIVTVGAIEDLYGDGSVDYSKADPWTCPSKIVAPGSAAAAAPAEKGYTILRKPKFYVPIPGHAEKMPEATSVDAAFVAQLEAAAAAAKAP